MCEDMGPSRVLHSFDNRRHRINIDRKDDFPQLCRLDVEYRGAEFSTFVTLDDKVKGSSLVSIRCRSVRADHGLAIVLDKLGDNARGNVQTQVLTLLQLKGETAGVMGELMDRLQLEVHERVRIQSRGNWFLGCSSDSLLGGSGQTSQLVTVVYVGGCNRKCSVFII